MATSPLSDLLRLSPAERLKLVQDLWDSIAAEPAALAVTDPQRQELSRRSRAHQNDPESAVDLDDALERIERSLG